MNEPNPFDRDYFETYLGTVLIDVIGVVNTFNWLGPQNMKILLSNVVHNGQVVAHHTWITHPHLGHPHINIGNRIIFDAEAIAYKRKDGSTGYGLLCLNMEILEENATTSWGIS